MGVIARGFNRIAYREPVEFPAKTTSPLEEMDTEDILPKSRAIREKE